MPVERVRTYLQQFEQDLQIQELDRSTATVQQAAAALHTTPARIAKSISLAAESGGVVVVKAGDAKIDNQKYKKQFQKKPKMLQGDQVQEITGFQPGGVCPFALPSEVHVYLDVSLKRFDTVFPACGSGNSAIELTIPALAEYSRSEGWVDVCTGWSEETEDKQV